MTELRDELKIRPDEGAVDYAERVEAVLEEHRLETGERLSAYGTMPGETPGEVLERLPVLKTADGIRSAEKARRRTQEGNGTNRGKENYVTSNASTAADEGSRRYRTKSQERDVEKAVSDFESARKRLYRSDGSKVYGEEGLAGEEAYLWLREKTLTVEHGGEPLSRYEVEFAAGTDKPQAIARPELFGTTIALAQPKLFGLDSLGEGGWLKTLRLKDYAPRRLRPESLQQALFPYHEAWG